MGAGCSARPAAAYKVDVATIETDIVAKEESLKDVLSYGSEKSTESGLSFVPELSISSASTSPAPSDSPSQDRHCLFCRSVGPDMILHGHVVVCNAFWKLNSVYSTPNHVKVGTAKELPSLATKMKSWTRSRWSVQEDRDGLKLECIIKRAQQPTITLLCWQSEQNQPFQVHTLQDLEMSTCEALDSEDAAPFSPRRPSKEVTLPLDEQPELTYEISKSSGGVSFKEEAEEFEIPRNVSAKLQPQVLYPFAIHWIDSVSHRRNCRVLGCESAEVRSEWTSRLRAYANIQRRFLVARVWVMRHVGIKGESEEDDTDLLTDVEDFDGPENPMHNLRSWKRRLVMLDLLREPSALCITYVSTKVDVSERIASVLATRAAGSVATVKHISSRMEIAHSASLALEQTLHTAQYDLATTGYKDLAMRIPSELSVLHIKQHAENLGGDEHTILGFDDDEECKLWFERIDAETCLCNDSNK